MSDNAKSLLAGLLQKDPETRLGGSRKDAEEVGAWQLSGFEDDNSSKCKSNRNRRKNHLFACPYIFG